MAKPMDGRTETLYLFPRHIDYWMQVYGRSSKHDSTDAKENANMPWGLEFSCCRGKDDFPFADELFHFDIYNAPGSDEIRRDLDETRQWISTEARSRYLHQLDQLKKGQISYFIGTLYFPDEPRFLPFNDQLPEGKTLFDFRNKNGSRADYAIVHVAGTAALTPDALCAQMEMLSSALLGRTCRFEIPAAAYPDKASFTAI